VPKGKRPVLSVEQQRVIESLTFHAAQDAFHIGSQTFGSLRSPRGQAQHHEVPFALVMERRDRGTFQADLREPRDQGATGLSRPAPNVTLAK